MPSRQTPRVADSKGKGAATSPTFEAHSAFAYQHQKQLDVFKKYRHSYTYSFDFVRLAEQFNPRAKSAHERCIVKYSISLGIPLLIVWLN